MVTRDEVSLGGEKERDVGRDFEKSCAAIAEALAGDPADDISLEEYRAQFEAEREARQRRREMAKTRAAA